MPTPCAGGLPRHSQPWAKLSALGTAAATAKSCSAHGTCTPVAEALCHQAWGWCSWLRAPSLAGRSRRITKTRVKRGLGLIFIVAVLGWDLPGLFWSTFQGTHEALSRREFVPALWARCQESSYKPWVQGPVQHTGAQTAEHPRASQLPAPCPAASCCRWLLPPSTHDSPGFPQHLPLFSCNHCRRICAPKSHPRAHGLFTMPQC